MCRRLPPFEYLAPTSLEEASALRQRYGAQASFLAGGTDLLIDMRDRKLTPQYLISLKQIPGLDGIGPAGPDGSLRIGALATHQAIADSPLIREATQAAKL